MIVNTGFCLHGHYKIKAIILKQKILPLPPVKPPPPPPHLCWRKTGVSQLVLVHDVHLVLHALLPHPALSGQGLQNHLSSLQHTLHPVTAGLHQNLHPHLHAADGRAP